tara:strand:- start:9094 stop:10275 length:1182 start_codon:yes stop_codon:yes gene_type:complete
MGSALRLGVVAGEASGDLLGARVLDALRARCGELVVEGVGGREMAARGVSSLYPVERLAVMGLAEPLRRLPELIRLRRRLARHFLDNPPDLFLGIDSPDFNLPLARRLRAAGVATAHLVSPSVWAWRAGRLKSIGKAVDLMLCLFPFEPELYRARGIAAECVGHPLATELADMPDQRAAREALQMQPPVAANAPLLALLPGSRVSEITALAPVFLQVAAQLSQERPELVCVLPVASDACRDALTPLLREYPALRLHLIEGRSAEVLAAADAALVTSGTATLEAMLLRRPMVVAWRTGALSWWLLSRMVRTPHVALPNILAGRAVVPEYLQQAATAENLLGALRPLLFEPAEQARCREEFSALRGPLALDFGRECSEALLKLASGGRGAGHAAV